jgi:hypothetical protein
MGPRPARVFVVFCKPILAILLQGKHQTIVMHLACWLCFVNPSILLQRKRLFDRKHLAADSRMFGVFCKPILAILLQRKHQTIIVHLESRISRVNSVASSRRQLTPFWKVQHATTECAN